MDLAAFKDYSIFAGLDDTEIKLFIDISTLVNVKKGETFIVEGELGDSIFLLLNGEVEVNQALTLSMNKSETDNREKAITKLSSDYKLFFGEMSLFNEGDRRTASIKALTDCKLLKIGKDELYEICDTHSEIGYKVMQNLCRTLCRHLVKANQNVLKLTTAFSLILER